MMISGHGGDVEFGLAARHGARPVSGVRRAPADDPIGQTRRGLLACGGIGAGVLVAVAWSGGLGARPSLSARWALARRAIR